MKNKIKLLENEFASTNDEGQHVFRNGESFPSLTKKKKRLMGLEIDLGWKTSRERIQVGRLLKLGWRSSQNWENSLREFELGFSNFFQPNLRSPSWILSQEVFHIYREGKLEGKGKWIVKLEIFVLAQNLSLMPSGKKERKGNNI